MSDEIFYNNYSNNNYYNNYSNYYSNNNYDKNYNNNVTSHHQLIHPVFMYHVFEGVATLLY